VRRRLATGLALALTGLGAGVAAQQAGVSLPADFPRWAFPGAKAEKLDPTSKPFAWVQIYDRTRAVDWHPENHPPMPEMVKGTQPVFACGFCHLPEGAGRPENAALAGLPEDYLYRQILELRSGARRSADPAFGPINNMITSMKLIPQAEFEKGAHEAAHYYASLTYAKHLKLIEATEVPAHSGNGFVNEFDAKAPKVPLGYAIVEGPEDFERFEMRDPNLTVLAYVPPGSAARGEALAKGDGGERPACSSCHGEGLKGSPIAPPLAGRLPTGLFRQLYSFQLGTRNGEQAALMKPVVAHLTQKEMLDLSVYAASLQP
jgi:cytochrome c553